MKKSMVVLTLGCVLMVPMVIWPMEQGGPARESKGKERVAEIQEEMRERLMPGQAGPSRAVDPYIVGLLRAAQAQLQEGRISAAEEEPSLQNKIINRIVDLIHVDQNIWIQLRDNEPNLPRVIKESIAKRYGKRHGDNLRNADRSLYLEGGYTINDLLMAGVTFWINRKPSHKFFVFPEYARCLNSSSNYLAENTSTTFSFSLICSHSLLPHL